MLYISEDEAKDALIQFVASKCCYRAAPSRGMVGPEPDGAEHLWSTWVTVVGAAVPWVYASARRTKAFLQMPFGVCNIK